MLDNGLKNTLTPVSISARRLCHEKNWLNEILLGVERCWRKSWTDWKQNSHLAEKPSRPSFFQSVGCEFESCQERLYVGQKTPPFPRWDDGFCEAEQLQDNGYYLISGLVTISAINAIVLLILYIHSRSYFKLRL